jgi:hypothetical protein
MVKVALAMLLFAGCNDTRSTPGRSGSAPQAAGASSPEPTSSPAPASSAAADPCATVGDAVKSIWDRQVADATDPEVKRAAQQMSDKAVARLQKHCRVDHWTPDVIDCVRGGGATCTNRMTPEQAQKLSADKLE